MCHRQTVPCVLPRGSGRRACKRTQGIAVVALYRRSEQRSAPLSRRQVLQSRKPTAGVSSKQLPVASGHQRAANSKEHLSPKGSCRRASCPLPHLPSPTELPPRSPLLRVPVRHSPPTCRPLAGLPALQASYPPTPPGAGLPARPPAPPPLALVRPHCPQPAPPRGGRAGVRGVRVFGGGRRAVMAVGLCLQPLFMPACWLVALLCEPGA